MESLQALDSLQNVVDREGRRSAVQMSIDDWDALLRYLEELEDRALVRAQAPRLRKGPAAAGAIPWEEARQGWNADE
jgi:hypothetical protein